MTLVTLSVVKKYAARHKLTIAGIVCSLTLLWLIWRYLTADFKSYESRRAIAPGILRQCALLTSTPQYPPRPPLSNNNNNNNNKNNEKKRRVGFFLIGTGKYLQLARQLILSMEKYFCTRDQLSRRLVHVHYFVFTDNLEFTLDLNGEERKENKEEEEIRSSNMSVVFQKHLTWPMSTLLRFENILRHARSLDFFATFDYLYWLDVDMKMVSHVCEDIMGDLVATMHPHYYTSAHAYPYESENEASRAYLPQEHRYESHYFVGAFYGGNALEMCKLLMTCDDNIQHDYKKLGGFIARVHDESHLNRYACFHFISSCDKLFFVN